MNSNEYSLRKPQNFEDTIDVSKYVNLVWSRKWSILFFAIVSAIVAFYFVMKITPTYQAKASMLFETREVTPVSVANMYGLDPSKKEFIQTQLHILKSNRIINSVIDKLQLKEREEFENLEEVKSTDGLFYKLKETLSLEDTNKHTLSDVVLENKRILNWFRKRLSVEAVRNTQVFNLYFEHEDPELAARIVNALGNAYIESFMEDKVASTNKAMDWLQERSEFIDEDLRVAEFALQDFVSKERLVDLQQGIQTVNADNIKIQNQRLLSVRNERIELQNLIAQINELKKVPDSNIAERLEESSIVRSLRRAEIESEGKYIELDQTYGPKHPKMIAAMAELTQIRQRLAQQVQREISDLYAQLSTLIDNEEKLESELSNAQGEFLSANEKETEYRRLKDDVERLTELKNLISTRFKEMDITSDFDSTLARFIDKASIPKSPIKPKRFLYVAVIFVIALFFISASLCLREALDNTIKYPQDVEDGLGTRLLGVIPKVKVRRQKALPLRFFYETNNRQFVESIRTIRTSYSLANVSNENTVTLVTSSIPREGKTTSAINLAFAFAQLDKVILIDADLRVPSLAEMFSIPDQHPGLVDFISGTHSLKECIFHDKESGVDVISSGHMTPFAQEVLNSARFEELIGALKNKYRRVVIDSAPCSAVSDAMLIARVADNALFVVKANHTKKHFVQNALNLLSQSNVKLEGTILNAVEPQGFSMNYHGYYDYFNYSRV